MTINSYTPELSGDWDLQLDASGNIKMLKGTSGIVQNVCCEGKNFRGGCYYAQDSGIAWFQDALEQKFRRPIIASRLREAAENVQGVQAVESVKIDAMDTATRAVEGEVIIETEEGLNGRAIL